MEEFNYKPKGTCSTNIKLLIDKDTLYDIEVTNDCRGRGTSCPDQIATAIKEYLGALVK